jgi:hypothetical protein
MSSYLIERKWVKDLNSVLDYTFDWSKWLGVNETIISHVISVTPTNHANNLTLDSTIATDKQVTAWLSSGRKNAKYTVTCLINTSEYRTESASILLHILEK